ncbi:sigma-70 family RNA polymerase sigma factor [Streptomyces cyaneochromogenes]|uniref:Sigma-70 family RNA polymerase sigma factor n=1 Tax=Streptomyces cyaneochromogenes TaxID=2496836 RepID=A0A3S9MB15_9ACTN|nr:sigma-70 family RNA polymerase sigma factor [Streptomyces cyaneochromogenes]AZQ36452.1 sigma-70 family RNA polymerase sigma factor [Streptomyces cyaneochromogenes]
MGEPRDANTEADLVAAVAEGDREAFELLYRHYAPWLVARLRHRCADDSLLDDIVQETFLNLWRTCAAGRQRQVADMGGWLWRIASRRLVDQARAGGARSRVQRALQRLRIRDEPSAEEEALAGGRHGDLADALARLPTELRRVMQATVVDGLTVRQAANVLGVPPGTVKTRAMRARKLLKQELDRGAAPRQRPGWRGGEDDAADIAAGES